MRRGKISAFGYPSKKPNSSKRLKNEISLYALFKYQTFMLAFAFAVFKQRAIYAGYF